MIGNDTDEIIQKLFDLLLRKYQIGSNSIFDYVPRIHYVFHKKNINCGGSYVDSPKWMQNKEKQ